MIAILFLYMLFASTFIVAKLVLNYCDPIFFIAVRMLVAGGLLLGYQYIFNRQYFRFSWQDKADYIQLIVFHIFFAYTLEFWGLKYMNPSKACLIYNISPFITALYTFYFFNIRVRPIQCIALCIGFFGLLPILLANAPEELQAGAFFTFSLPEIALLIAVASSAYGWIVMKKLMNKDYSPIMANGIAMVGGGILSGITSLLLEGIPRLKDHVPTDWLSMQIAFLAGSTQPIVFFLVYGGAIIIVSSIICYNLYGFLLKKYSPTFLSFAGFCTPLIVAVYDALLTGQKITIYFSISLLLTSFGLYLFYKDDYKNGCCN